MEASSSEEPPRDVKDADSAGDHAEDNRKRRARDEDADERSNESGDDDELRHVKARRLTQQEQMQLRMLAALPSMQEPLKDSRGRRRATCVSSSEIVDAGLASLISAHVVAGNAECQSRDDVREGALADTVDEPPPKPLGSLADTVDEPPPKPHGQ